ncbi:MAG: sensor histidine kinase [Acidimicrobiales bacterium]
MSLRVRLLMAAAAMVALALIAVDFGTYSQLKSNLYNQVDTRLDTSVQQLLQTLHFPTTTYLVGGSVETRDADDNVLSDNDSGTYSPMLPAHVDGYVSGAQGLAQARLTVASRQAGGPRWRALAERFPDGSQLILALPLDQVSKTLHHQARVDLAVTLLALVGVVMLGFWLVQLSLHPLAEMEETAAAIADGDLSRRVPGDDAPTEVGQLARSLNQMLTRIQDAFAARDATERQLRQSEERLRRFVADASHELRTPVAAVGAYAELFERGAANRPEDLARLLSGIRNETARMGGLVEDLLLLARLDEGRPVEQEPVELVGLAAEAVGAATTVGPDWPVRLEAHQTVEIIGDAARLRQVVDNLLANVRAHTPRGTAAVVRVGSRDGYGVIEVADNGPGLPPESAGRVFERFYRADPSRSRQNGGAGLGLAIVAAIVAAHRGSVAVGETPGGGASITVWLPTVDAATRPDFGAPADSATPATSAASAATAATDTPGPGPRTATDEVVYPEPGDAVDLDEPLPPAAPTAEIAMLGGDRAAAYGGPSHPQ